MKPLTLYGWPVSPYTAKTKAWLKGKGIPFTDRVPSYLFLHRVVRKNVGRIIMPTVRLPQGDWLQDSTEIIDTLAALHPKPALQPTTPRQRLVSLLLELYADEWLPMVALHYRWNIEENAAFAINAFGAHGLPFLPTLIRRPLARRIAQKMKGYLPVLGVTEHTQPGVEGTALALISHLNEHLRGHRFLLGERPCTADYALYGPLYAHLYRDPGTTDLFSPYKEVSEWLLRLHEGKFDIGEYLAEDEVPASLEPILQMVFEDQIPWIQTTLSHIENWCEKHPDATRVPRALGTAPFSIRDLDGTRKIITEMQWKAQRPILFYQALQGKEKTTTTQWLTACGGENFTALTVAHPMIRKAHKPVLNTLGARPSPAES
jgi:glutathione S-transferase